MRYTSGLIAALLLGACSDNLTPPFEIERWQGEPPATAECFPNLDGVIEFDELAPATGVPVNYRVTAPGAEVNVDLAGLRDASGARVWDYSAPNPADRSLEVQALAVSDAWFASDFPNATFATALDGNAVELGVYSHSSQGLFLHGFASSNANSPQRTLMRYTDPVLIYPFPLQKGREWVAVGEVVNGTFRGLPYAGRDTYTSIVSDEGEVWLPSIQFLGALQVKTLVQAQPAVGQSTSRVQVSWLFECFGEVMRAVSLDGETNLDFARASELRRLGF